MLPAYQKAFLESAARAGIRVPESIEPDPTGAVRSRRLVEQGVLTEIQWRDVYRDLSAAQRGRNPHLLQERVEALMARIAVEEGILPPGALARFETERRGEDLAGGCGLSHEQEGHLRSIFDLRYRACPVCGHAYARTASPPPADCDECGAPLDLEDPSQVATECQDPYVGRSLGPYRLRRRLGFGGMAVVYLAERSDRDDPAAVKILPHSLAADPALRQRFEREAGALSKVAHRNVVGVLDAGFDRSTAYLAMEYVEGESVGERLASRGTPFEWGEAVRIAKDVAGGLACAHEQGMVHRDVKPANLILTPGGDVKIVDFGLVHMDGSSLTGTGHALGTPGFMAPEQVSGTHVDARTDVFGLGATLYAMLTGRAPFAGESPAAAMMATLNDPFPSIRERNPRVPPALEKVVERMCARDIDRRHSDMLSVIDALEGVRAIGSAARTGSGARFRRGPLLAIAGIAIALLGAFPFLRSGNESLPADPGEPAPGVGDRPDAREGAPDPGRLSIDDFETGPPPGTTGWAVESDPGEHPVEIEIVKGPAFSGTSSMRIAFAIHGEWATVHLGFQAPRAWEGTRGIGFRVRADRAGLAVDVRVCEGDPAVNLGSYCERIRIPDEAVTEWAPIDVPWERFRRVSWEEGAGSRFVPGGAVAIGFGFGEDMRLEGTLWIDDLELLPRAGVTDH